MPRTKRRNKFRYTDQERRVLLTGTPVSSESTRFGHPKASWNLAEIEDAWHLLEDELLEEWEGEQFAYYRERYKEPFAVRLLRDEGRML
jgi:hypothetical protein